MGGGVEAKGQSKTAPQDVRESHAPNQDVGRTSSQPHAETLWQRVFKDTEKVDGRQNWILKMLGWYAPEGRVRGASREIFQDAITVSESDGFLNMLGIREAVKPSFNVRFEFLGLHLWMAFIPLRKLDNMGMLVQQTLSDLFMTELQKRMSYEEGIGALSLSKWGRECEQIFFATMIALDKVVYDSSGRCDLSREAVCSATEEVLLKNLASLENDPHRARLLVQYLAKTIHGMRGLTLQDLYQDAHIFSVDSLRRAEIRRVAFPRPE
ncbi:hypothetical protein FVE85_0494 [Porphyridium purpureum]|uniref:Ubiquinol-cytochrome c chaperone domain-containing protein n=1 Tax=Porphyridium purpureum TaxID=35688 RepID=A0A5J4Z026_PORPP|nr:hypothetical protein FVE85_0494 [Porphyridium purpureum]|eukprot:POR2631..scf208_2